MAISNSAATNAAIQNEVDEINRKLEKLLESFAPDEKKKMLRKGARLLINAAKANVPVSSKSHDRYSTPKLSGKLKAPKGSGNVVATYMPGNLKRSIRVLRFRRSDGIWVGPKVNKSGTGNTFSGNRVDGYYAHWVEFGTVHMNGVGYMRRAFNATKNIIEALIEKEAAKKVAQFNARNNV